MNAKAILVGAWLVGCADTTLGNGQSTPFDPPPDPAPAPAKTQITLSGNRSLEGTQPGGVAHETRAPDRYFFGVAGGDDETQWRFHMRLAAADLQHGVVRGTLAPLIDVGEQGDTGRTRIGYVGMYTKSDGITTEPPTGDFEITLSANRIVGWVKADPVNGVDVSASFEAELDAICFVVVPTQTDPAGGSIPEPGAEPPLTMKEDRALVSPGCERLRAFAQR